MIASIRRIAQLCLCVTWMIFNVACPTHIHHASHSIHGRPQNARGMPAPAKYEHGCPFDPPAPFDRTANARPYLCTCAYSPSAQTLAHLVPETGQQNIWIGTENKHESHGDCMAFHRRLIDRIEYWLVREETNSVRPYLSALRTYVIEESLGRTWNQNDLTERAFALIDQYKTSTDELPCASKLDSGPLCRLSTIETLQTALQGDEALLHFFSGHFHIYAFVITKDTVAAHRTDKDEVLKRNTTRLLAQLTHYDPACRFSEDDAFETHAHALYQRLIYPFENVLRDRAIRRLAVVPDKELSDIPFDVLITEPRASLHQWKSYLIRDYTIRYLHSASDLYRSTGSQLYDSTPRFLGMAPSFDGPRKGGNIVDHRGHPLTRLICNQEEVRYAHRRLGGQVHLGASAGIFEFLSTAASSDIIHMATHATIDADQAELNKIYLHDGHLTQRMLRNMDLDISLIVLSACHTASGPLRDMDGAVYSLARAFSNAGCRASLASLWALDDCTTSAILRTFYDRVASGDRIDDALRIAKMHFLKTSHPMHRHPFYWASLVHHGNSDALFGDHSNYYYTALFRGR